MVNIGIIGCGKIAQVRHLPEYAANPRVNLVGYYDLNEERAREVAHPGPWADLPMSRWW